MHFTVFSGFAKELKPYSHAKILNPRARHLYGVVPFPLGEYKPVCLFRIRYLGRNGCQADYEKLKITSLGIILWILTSDCRLARCLFVAWITRIALTRSAWNKSKGETVW